MSNVKFGNEEFVLSKKIVNILATKTVKIPESTKLIVNGKLATNT